MSKLTFRVVDHPRPEFPHSYAVAGFRKNKLISYICGGNLQLNIPTNVMSNNDCPKKFGSRSLARDFIKFELGRRPEYV